MTQKFFSYKNQSMIFFPSGTCYQCEVGKATNEIYEFKQTEINYYATSFFCGHDPQNQSVTAEPLSPKIDHAS